ncbi:hypothetical protein PAMP_020242 [Pampus punctatissimus]
MLKKKRMNHGGNLEVEGMIQGIKPVNQVKVQTINRVSVGLLHGRATYIIWPPNRWQQIKPSLPPNRGPLDTDED